MTDINETLPNIVVSPRLTLIAFHLCRELTQERAGDAESIWLNLAGLSSSLNIPELESLSQLIGQNESNKSDRSLSEKIQELLPNSVLSFRHSATNNLPAIEGGIYPLKMHDTYAVDLTINYLSDRFPLDSLHQINPQGCLFPSKIKASLGQTIMLFDRRLNSSQNTSAIAENIIQEISKSDGNSSPAVANGKGTFLGGNIYQFEDDLLDPTRRKHFLVWFANSSQTLALEETGNYYYPLLNLLCSRHKIQFAYYQARQAYKKARQLYGKIEPVINNFSLLKIQQNRWLKTELEQVRDRTKDRKLKQQINSLLNSSPAESSDRYISLTESIEQYLQEVSNKRIEAKLRQSQQQRLQKLENWLIEIPQMSVDYARYLRDIQTNLTTIAINGRNYQIYLTRLQEIASTQDDLTFLATFRDRDCHEYQEQIGYDIEYLTAGKALFERTIDAIRGLVAIDAQKQQLAEEIAEGERDRRIELWVTVVGSGLAVSALTSAIMPQPVQPLLKHYDIEYQKTWYGNQASLLFWNVLLHSVIGIMAAVLAAVVFRGAIESFLKFLGDRIRQR